MPTYATSQEWLHQSSLLLEARPATTRITTRYHIKPASGKRSSRKNKKGEAGGGQSAQPEPSEKPPRGHLVLRTYDPVSGAMLRYRTSKAAEVAHLVQMLGTLGRSMAALPPRAAPEPRDDTLPDAPSRVAGGEEATDGRASGEQTPLAGTTGQPQQQGGGSGGGAGKGKKKKGKR